ncbi:hypothetical protein POTOM_026800 [Populus tomentosa]|uniref:Uncharacterized protein n=1 Tax=Populus tomentosa TaxID=118781 RepID=A0A8X7ZFS9_POPTO|nr:hypothetical protein POTOM_026800 [Populus tomentosa]
MLRALNKQRNPNRYGRLDKEPDTTSLLAGELETSESLPAHEVSGSPKLSTLGRPEVAPQNVSSVKPSRRKDSKSHPLFSLCDGAGRKKKPTARPEFARYLQYVKEGGIKSLDYQIDGDELSTKDKN